jgi:hypothetical protein
MHATPPGMKRRPERSFHHHITVIKIVKMKRSMDSAKIALSPSAALKESSEERCGLIGDGRDLVRGLAIESLRNARILN